MSDWQLTTKLTKPDPITAKLAIQALFKLMAPGLAEIAAELGIPVHKPVPPAERQARIDEIARQVIAESRAAVGLPLDI